MAPKVIAHRGASAYRPENTLEAFELGLAQGADGLEFDLVTTADQKLIIRHENALSGTTNISDVPEYASFTRQGVVEGEVITDWFSEDLTLEQIGKLRAKERLADLRPGSAKFDSLFRIPTFNQLLNSPFIKDTELIVELKQGSHTKSLEKSLALLAAEEIIESQVLNKNVQITVESFDYELVKEAKQALNSVPCKYLFALENTSIAEVNLEELSKAVDGLTISLEMLFAENWVELCHQAGLEVWAYTARAENSETTIEEYYERIIQTGVDAIFADQPDLLRRVLDERSGSTYDY